MICNNNKWGILTSADWDFTFSNTKRDCKILKLLRWTGFQYIFKHALARIVHLALHSQWKQPKIRKKKKENVKEIRKVQIIGIKLLEGKICLAKNKLERKLNS